MKIDEIFNRSSLRPDPWPLKDPKKIEAWLNQMGVEFYHIRDDGVVDVGTHVFLQGKRLTSIPIQFGEVHSFFDCSNNQLTSLRGAPYFVGDRFFCSRNQLTSLQYAPRKIEGDFQAALNNIKTLEGIDIEEIGGFLSLLTNDVKRGGIGLMKIKGLQRIIAEPDTQFETAVYIIEECMQNKESIFECQARLIDEGFEEYAKL